MRALVLPLETVSESNQRCHWAKRAKRAARQRGVTALACAVVARGVALPVVVTLTRISPKALDDDNLRGAMKAVRDGVADAFGLDDRNPQLRFEYAQRRGGVGERAVGISIQSVAP